MVQFYPFSSPGYPTEPTDKILPGNPGSPSGVTCKEHIERPLLAKIEKLQAENILLRHALDKHGEHTKQCQEKSVFDYEHKNKPICTCGFEDIMKAGE